MAETKEIIYGRRLVEEDIPLSILELLRFQGWLHFLSMDAPTNTNLVEEFYSNLQLEDEGDMSGKPCLRSIVGGVEIQITVHLLKTLFKLKTHGIEFYSKNEWIANDLFDRVACLKFLNGIDDSVEVESYRSLNRPLKKKITGNWLVITRIIKENLAPILNKDQQLSILECQMLYMILKKQKFSLPSLIIGHMVASQNRKHLPYGLILSFIFHKFRVINAPKKGFSNLLDEKALSHQKVYKWQNNYLSAEEFQALSHEDQQEYRRLHKIPLSTSEGETPLKRSRTTQGRDSQAPTENVSDIVEQLKHYMRHKLIKPMRMQMGRFARSFKGLERKVDNLKHEVEMLRAEQSGDVRRTQSMARSQSHGASSFRPPSPRKGKGIAYESLAEESDWGSFAEMPRRRGGIRINEPTQGNDSDSSSSSRTHTQT